MVSQQSSKVSQVDRLVDIFMQKVGEVADDEDWLESDGWVGQIVIVYPDRDSVHTYAIKDGKFHSSDSHGPFVAIVRMSVDTFIDLLTAAASNAVACPACGRKVQRRKPCAYCVQVREIPEEEAVPPDNAEGWAEFLFIDKYRRKHIGYVGDTWIVDSERFRKVFKRMARS